MIDYSKTVLEKFNDLRESYIAALPEKLASIDEAWAAFDRGKGDPGQLEALHHLVHGVAGSGGTFGFADLSIAARNLEVLIKTLRESDHLISQEHRNQIKRLMTDLHTAAEKSDFSPMEELPPVKSVQEPEERHVFVVEDDKHLARELARQLRHAGYEVSVFATPEGLKDRIDKTPPAAIIMDMVFPEGELAGAEAISEIQHAREQLIPVVFMSVRNDIEARLSAARTGCTRYFTKPLAVNQIVEALDELTTDSAMHPYRVLIVDDDVPLSRMYAFALKQADILTSVVNDPLKALERIAEFKPELILTDVYMPGCKGTELAAVIRQDPSYTNVSIVFLSTETDLDKQMAAMKLGGDDFLTKPIDFNVLIEMVMPRVKRTRALKTLTRDLRDSERKYRGVVNDISIGIVLIDRDMKILSLNPRIHQWFPQLYEGTDWGKYFEDFQDDNGSAPPWILCLRDGRVHEAVVKIPVDDAVRHYRIVSSPILDEDGEVANMIQAVEDISERVRGEEALRQSEKRYSDLFANMSHEIRTPMTAVIGMADLLWETTLSDEQKKFVETIRSSGENLLQLINDILAKRGQNGNF